MARNPLAVPDRPGAADALRLRHRAHLSRRWCKLLPLAPHGRCQRRDRPAGDARRWSWRAATAATSGRSGSGRTCCRCGRSSRCCSAPAACSRRRPAAGRCSRCRCRPRAAVCSASAPRPGWRSCWCSPSSPRCCCRCSRRSSGRPTASATRSSTARACSSPAPCSSAWRFCCPPCSATCGGPLLIALCVAAVLRLFDVVLRDLSRYSLFGVMSGETYFRGGGLPWLGLLASAAVSAAMLYGAAIEHRAPGFLTRQFTRRTLMRAFTRLLLVAALLLVPATSLLAQTAVDPSGHWEGTVQAAEHGGERRNRSGEEQQRRARRHVQPTGRRREGPSALDRRRREPVGPLRGQGRRGAGDRSRARSRPTASRCRATSRRAEALVPLHPDTHRRREDCAGAEERRRSARSSKAPGTAPSTSAGGRCGSS